MVVGLRVVRAPNWKFGNEDGGPNHVGTVTELLDNEQVKVQWDMGQTTVCDVGHNGIYDLKIFDSAPLGIRHFGVQCDGCGEENIFGMRWKCAICDDYDLCTPCYYDDSHLPTHPFMLIEFDGDKPVKLAKRLTSQRERVMGIFPGATVTEGPDIEINDFSNGIIEDIVSIRSDTRTYRDAVSVVSTDGSTRVFRLGFQGKVDIICTEKASGPNYYPDHIPVVDMKNYRSPSMVQLRTKEVDDLIVCVALSVPEFKKIQQTRFKWSSDMEELVYSTMKVKALTEEGDFIVDYYDRNITIHKDAASRVPRHEKGHTVKVIEDSELLRNLQIGHGGWLEEIEKVKGLIGKVTTVDEDGDVGVTFQSTDFVFHPLALIPIDVVNGSEFITDNVEIEDHTATNNKSTPRKDIRDSLDALKDLADLVMIEALVRAHANDIKVRFLKAVINGNKDEVRMLLQRFPNLKDTRHEGLSCVCIAANEGHFGVIKAMLDEGSDIDMKDERGFTALVMMIIKNKLGSAIFLIDNGADVNKTITSGGQTVLHLAAQVGTSQAVKLLLERKCDPNVQDVVGDTPLHDAIDRQNDKAAEVLMQWPTLNIWLKNKAGFTTLVEACRVSDHLFSVDALITRTPALVNSPEGRTNNGEFPLHVAAINDHVAVMKVLLEKGKANVDCRNNEQITPLHLAAKMAHMDAVSLLLTLKADCNFTDENGNTPFHYCLLGRRNNNMMSLLMGISYILENAERKAVARVLIENGADTQKKNNNGRTAVETCSNVPLRTEVRRLILDRKFTLLLTQSGVPPSNATGNSWCRRCSDKVIDTIFVPCMHTIACSKCCKQYKKCPVCRQTISGVTDKYTTLSKHIASPSKANEVTMPPEEFQKIQQINCKWDPIMEELICHPVRIKAITREGDFVVSYFGSEITIYKEAASMVPKHKQGNLVSVIKDVKLLQKLQIRHGGWLDGMKKVIGSTGQVTAIDEDGDVEVNFSDATLVFHPLSITPVQTAYDLECGTDDADLDGIVWPALRTPSYQTSYDNFDQKQKLKYTESQSQNVLKGTSNHKEKLFERLKQRTQLPPPPPISEVRVLQQERTSSSHSTEQTGASDQFVTDSAIDISVAVKAECPKTTLLKPTRQCRGCSVKRVDTIFWPCEHEAACSKCCKNYKKCPVCRKAVRGITDKYGDYFRGSRCRMC